MSLTTVKNGDDQFYNLSERQMKSLKDVVKKFTIERACLRQPLVKLNSKIFTLFDDVIDDLKRSRYASMSNSGFVIRDSDGTCTLPIMIFNLVWRLNDSINYVEDRLKDYTYKSKQVEHHYESVLRFNESLLRLNSRTLAFKPWKLYSSKPIYPCCMSPFSYYDNPNPTEFDSKFIMPEDIGSIITSFVGYEFLSKFRYDLVLALKGRCVIRNEIESALEKWKKNKLLNFAQAIPYNYFKYDYLNAKPTLFILNNKRTKKYIINHLMNNFHDKELYYSFYRDVMILTPIVITKQKVVVRM
jgi:hypothetical protein